jgi:hypothetical protein
MEQQIRRLEEVLGDYKYQRTTPIIKVNNWLNRYSEGIKTFKDKPRRYLKALMQATLWTSNMSLYYDESNTILIQSKTSKDDLFPGLGLYHEIGHSMLHDLEPANPPPYPYKKVSTIVLENLLRKRTTRDKIERAFVQHAIIEGTCEYLSIEAQKLEIKEGRKPEEVYCYTRERNLVKFNLLKFDKSRKPEKKILKPTPLSKEKGETIEEISNNLIELVPTLYKNWLPKRILNGLYVIAFIETCARNAGYYLARSSCEAHPELSKKQVFQSLFSTPPENIHQLQQTILDNIEQAQKNKEK